MKRSLTMAFAALLACGAVQATDVGVSVSVSQPGVFGRIDIGRFPQPQVVVAQPVVIAQPRVVVEQPPVYLYVPAEHRRHWGRHCHRYGACGSPVYFVRHDWYQQQHARADHHRDHDKHAHRGHGDRRGNGHGRHKHDD